MRLWFIRTNTFIKNIVIFLRPGLWIGFLQYPFLFATNLLGMTRWISKQSRSSEKILNDAYGFKRRHDKRIQLHEYVIQKENLNIVPIDYLEFGVFDGKSFRWWMSAHTHADSRFYGFDTFEGLPENWGIFRKGDMFANTPQIEDTRHKFYKGYFQHTLFDFEHEVNLHNNRRKVIHMDADLFSSTLFVLTTLAQYLRPGDIILFDEFNVPNHEYYAFDLFCKTYYIKCEMIGAVNTYYQVAFRVVECNVPKFITAPDSSSIKK
jgi:hypothetical protein